MRLTPKELDRLTVFTLAELARRRRARGRRLNLPEAMAIICDEIFEQAWDGRPLAEVIEAARSVLTRADVMEGVPEVLRRIEVDALFPSGTALVVVDHPIGPPEAERSAQAPGAVLVGEEPITINAGRLGIEIAVENTSEYPVEVSSHYHFFEANRCLRFDRRAALGMRLDIPAGSGVIWEAGERKRVSLIPFGGGRIAWGFNGLVNGRIDEAEATALTRGAVDRGFAHEEAADGD